MIFYICYALLLFYGLLLYKTEKLALESGRGAGGGARVLCAEFRVPGEENW